MLYHCLPPGGDIDLIRGAIFCNQNNIKCFALLVVQTTNNMKCFAISKQHKIAKHFQHFKCTLEHTPGYKMIVRKRARW